ncbi:phosphatase PAP2 family protein [Chitinophaga tropicalis]|uniref:Phosphatase PAP2 family protein n=1 Tax=Chitinophaga tropicalis TaxID=2683588 RepID=A0A7K1U4X5_9BACT|nr:phosphatase PAP2 family protein [Chitinophaga tropicalis]MVT09336.1 phosphatase PAP2 family protein [Chitinophaga tropicalis]
MKAYRYLFSLYLAVLAGQIHAQQTTVDSLPAIHRLKYTPRQLYIPGALMLAGLLANRGGQESLKMEVVEERNEHMPRFHTHIDNYLQYSPIAAAYLLDACGVKSRTDVLNRTAILIKGELMMTALVSAGKSGFHVLRPDGSTHNSFPSGHTAQAFAGATFLSTEYGERFRWMPYAAYGVASGVGCLRMANNRHYISDVLMGAGLGVLTMKVAYWTHRYKWGRHRQQIRPVE